MGECRKNEKLRKEIGLEKEINERMNMGETKWKSIQNILNETGKENLKRLNRLVEEWKEETREKKPEENRKKGKKREKQKPLREKNR